MSKAYLAAFAAFAVLAVGAVDYVNQAKAAGSKPGRYAFGDYVGTISGRFIYQRQVMAAAAEREALLATVPRELLPEAPEGWTRHDWDETSVELFGSPYDMRKDDSLPDAVKKNPTMNALAALDRAATDRMYAREVYVYEKPGATIAVRLSIARSADAGGISGVAMKIAANNIEAMSGKEGFAVVKGVAFRRDLGLFGAAQEDSTDRSFSGRIGETVSIGLRTNAKDADVVALLNEIDFDRLNKTLEVPVAGIGSDAPEIAPGDQAAEAKRRVDADSLAQRVEAARAMLRLKEAALEMTHRHGETSEEDYIKEKADHERERAAIDEWAATEAAALQKASAEASQETETAQEDGGFLGQLLGRVGFGGGSADKPIEPAEAGAAAKIKVNSFGAGKCQSAGLAKRCSVGG